MKKFVDNNFISIYENALSEKECNIIIDEFEKNPNKKPGRCDYKIQLHIKRSTDITYDMNNDCITSVIVGTRLEEHVNKYIEEHPDINNHLQPWSCIPKYNVQKYEPNEGFYKSHCENLDKESSYRVLVWMFYLNTVSDGGTIFPTLETKIDAIRGRLVVWPAYWTHVHRGQISESQTKYIATGWHGFI